MNTTNRNFTLKEEIRAYWSDRATTFDQSASHHIDDRYGMPEWHRLVRTAFNLGVNDTLKEKNVLDIACGTGEISRVLTSLGADVTGIDFSQTMLDIASNKLCNASWNGILSDAEMLHQLSDDSFDFAVTRHLAWTLTEPHAAYSEWRRVLRPGGSLLIVDGDWVAQRSALIRLRCWLANRLSPLPERAQEDIRQNNEIKPRLDYAKGLKAATLKDDMRVAGFATFTDLPVGRLYRAGMRGLPLAERLRQNSEHRFAFVAS